MAETTSIYECLRRVQGELKAPKGQYNSFAKFSYRSAEDIVEAAKPLCHEEGLVLLLTDTIENVGERYYVRADVTVANDAGETLSASAYAREDAEKKGMDGSQITGAASSYARKYALNGLFAIDDTKDADSDVHSGKPETKSRPAIGGPDEGKPTQDAKAAAKAALTARLQAVMKQLAIKPDERADFFQSAIGKDKPETFKDIEAAVEKAEVLIADEEERAKELEVRV